MKNRDQSLRKKYLFWENLQKHKNKNTSLRKESKSKAKPVAEKH